MGEWAKRMVSASSGFSHCWRPEDQEVLPSSRLTDEGPAVRLQGILCPNCRAEVGADEVRSALPGSAEECRREPDRGSETGNFINVAGRAGQGNAGEKHGMARCGREEEE